jgi:hypothetical protein
MIGTTIAACTLMGIGYAAALQGGWIVNESMAQGIAQQAVAPEERKRLELHLELKYNRLRMLNNLTEKTPDDLMEIESLRDDIRLLKEALSDG